MKRTSRNAVAILISGGVNLLLIGWLPLLNRNEFVEEQVLRMVSIVRQPKLDMTIEVVEESLGFNLPVIVEPDPLNIEFELARSQVKPIPWESAELDLAAPNIMVHQMEMTDTLRYPRGNQNHLTGLTGQILDMESVTDPPRDIRNESPPYPQIARRHNAEGSVKIKILIDENGEVEQTQILECVGHPSFRGAVRKTVPHWRFTPPRHHGQPLKVWCVREIEFKLDL